MNAEIAALNERWLAAASGHGLNVEDRTLLARRLRRWGPDLLDGLGVYASTELPGRVLDLIAVAFADRRPALRELDEVRALHPDWFAEPDQVGYVCYTERFAGTLRGVQDKISYLRELGVSYLHLMPLLDSPDGPDDGGYAVRDFRRVRPDLGTMQDLAALADALHDQQIALTLDLVINHVAADHAWALAAAHDPRYWDYFWTFADRELPDRYEASLPQVFPELAPGNFTWVPELDDGTGRWVWTTFNSYQWDLNWANPDVFCDVLDVVLALANVGVDCFRLDAIAFLGKRLGTSCQNQPEVHDIVAALRAAVRIAAPASIFKAEAIVGPEQLPAYLGTGRHAGKVCDLAYHNSLMVQLWSSLASGDATLARRALAAAPPKPVTTAWGTYVRCHDDIGWAISDEHAASVGLSGSAHRAFLSRFYSGTFPGSFARGEVFQADPATGEARISGTLASLAGLEAALATGDSAAIDLALGRIFLVHAAIYGYGGIPLLYMGDELGLRNDSGYRSEPRWADDNRWLHRPYLSWETAEKRHDPASVEGRIFSGLRHLARRRASLAALHAAVESTPVDVGTSAVLAWIRRHPAGTILALHNISGTWQAVPAGRVTALVPGPLHDQLSQVDRGQDPGEQYLLAPYAVWWLCPVE